MFLEGATAGRAERGRLVIASLIRENETPHFV